MPDLLAKGVALTVAALLLIVVGVLYFTSRPPAGANEVTAEFDNAFPLIEGMYVRVDGAIAGSVGKITVNDQGNAEVELELDNSIEPPTANATAAIRQQDTTGDSYVAYDPGNAKQPLGPDGIACKSYDECDHTLVAPRLDDLLNSFGSNQRAGIKLILDETAKALDRRGADLNAAALQLKPAVAQADIALQQVNSQNDALKQLLASSENVTGQLASRNKRLGDLIGSLSATLDTVSQQTGPLDESLAKLPETASRARTTLAALTRTAQTAQPLAEQTARSAPLLASALRRFPGFLDNASSFLTDTRSTLVLTKHVLKAAQPTLEIGKKNVVTGSFDLIGATSDLLNSVLGGKDAFPALFGDDSYGHGEGTLGKRGFGSVAVEPGDLPGYPSSWKPRNWLRVSAVINCEVFGVPVHPGCLTEALSSLRAKQRAENASNDAKRSNALADAAKAVRGSDAVVPGSKQGGGRDHGSGGGGSSGGGNQQSGGGSHGGHVPDLPDLGKDTKKGLGAVGKALGALGKNAKKGLGGVGKGLGGVGKGLGGGLENLGGKQGVGGVLGRKGLDRLKDLKGSGSGSEQSYRDLMNYLLG